MSNEVLWAGQFGDDYTDRCINDSLSRLEFWGTILKMTLAKYILEVGCNTGQNLGCIAEFMPDSNTIWGCDVNNKALSICKTRHREHNIIHSSGFDLPFRDSYFDLVFTAGVLIHQKPEEVEVMMQEIMRVSRLYVLALEYGNSIFEDVPYRNQREALFKGPYGEIYEKKYGLRFVAAGYLYEERVDGKLITVNSQNKEGSREGITWWLLSKR